MYTHICTSTHYNAHYYPAPASLSRSSDHRCAAQVGRNGVKQRENSSCSALPPSAPLCPPLPPSASLCLPLPPSASLCPSPSLRLLARGVF